VTEVRRGRLDDPAAAPAVGERHEVLAHLGHTRIEQILSGELEDPQRFVGDDDEWVVVLAGTARLELGGVSRALEAGDWVLIPAGSPHVLHETAPGTLWLAVHAPPSGDALRER
jgi:mannose-6-phosphate isomerase-like protein (cupin superfamily)